MMLRGSRKTSLRQDRDILWAISTQKNLVSETARTLVFTITSSTVNRCIQATNFQKYHRIYWKPMLIVRDRMTCILWTKNHMPWTDQLSSVSLMSKSNSIWTALMAEHTIDIICNENLSGSCFNKKNWGSLRIRRAFYFNKTTDIVVNNDCCFFT